MKPQANLRLIDPDSGEIVSLPTTLEEAHAEIKRMQDQLDGAEHEIRSYRQRIANMKRNADLAARNDKLWPIAVEVFNYWRDRCKHPNSKFTTDRFEQISPHLQAFGPEICKRAIDGAAFDPFTTKRRNGSVKRHDGWDLIFRNAEKVEEFANRAPVDRSADHR